MTVVGSIYSKMGQGFDVWHRSEVNQVLLFANLAVTNNFFYFARCLSPANPVTRESCACCASSLFQASVMSSA